MKSAAEVQFSAFVREHRHGLVRWATTLTAGDTHLAEDLVQQCLSRVYRRWAQAQRNPLSYTRRTLLNAFIDHRRRPVSRRERSVERLPELPVPGPESSDDHLLEALRALPPRMRAVVTLRYVEDLSVEETAQLLGCSTGTIKSQAARALAKLRNTLAQASGVR